jgi:hypothetical protein
MSKTLISIRLDSDLLEWFKQSAPDGYQVKIHEILMDYRRQKVRRECMVLGRAQQIFSQYHAKCFWHLRKDLKIDLDNLSIVREGLKKYGGIEGIRLSAELELN